MAATRARLVAAPLAVAGIVFKTFMTHRLRIVAPLRALSSAAQRLGSGEFGVQVAATGSGEIAGRANLRHVHGPFTAEELRAHRDKHLVDDKFLDEYAAGMIEHDMHVGQFLDLLDELGLRPGDTVTATVKATDIQVYPA